MRNYNMKNIQIEETTICSGTVKTVLIYADTERFGEHEIMAQLPNRKEALTWLEENGVDLHELAVEWLDEQIGAAGGRVQIANTMYRRLHRDNGGAIWGYSSSSGYCNITKYFENAAVVGEHVAKTNVNGACWVSDGAYMREGVRSWGYTIKFGNACTW